MRSMFGKAYQKNPHMLCGFFFSDIDDANITVYETKISMIQ